MSSPILQTDFDFYLFVTAVEVVGIVSLVCMAIVWRRGPHGRRRSAGKAKKT